MTTLSERWEQALANNYGTPAIGLLSGAGAVVFDETGKSYVDMLAGIAVNALGHGHPAVIEAVTKQISRLGHVSNFFVAEPTVALAELLLALTGRPGRVLFCNSGAEANEAAFKLSRLTGRTKIIAAEQAFHGRTMGALALTGQPSKRDPFKPLPAFAVHVPFGDVEALRAEIDDQTAMVILEPIMGEAGVVPAPPGYLAAARSLCDKHGALLALDEVQTGVGRTGHWFAHQAEGVAPDVITLAKALGGGLPIGAMVAFADGAFAASNPGGAAALFKPGQHGTTFGGNPVACAAALAVLRTIAADGLLDHVKRVGERLRRGIWGLPYVTDVRGAGLLLGIVLGAQASASASAGAGAAQGGAVAQGGAAQGEAVAQGGAAQASASGGAGAGKVAPSAGDVADALREKGFLVNAAQPDVIRIAPPLILTNAQADAFVVALAEVLEAAQ